MWISLKDPPALWQIPGKTPVRSSGKSFTSYLDKEFGLMEAVPTPLETPPPPTPLSTASRSYEHSKLAAVFTESPPLLFYFRIIKWFLFPEALQWMRPQICPAKVLRSISVPAQGPSVLRWRFENLVSILQLGLKCQKCVVYLFFQRIILSCRTSFVAQSRIPFFFCC